MLDVSSFWRAGLFSALALSAVACSGSGQTAAPFSPNAETPFKPEPVGRTATNGGTDCADLIAGQHYDAGDVCISNDGDSISVCFETQDGWKVFVSHLYVGLEPPDSHAPGQFPYQTEHPGGATEFCYDIPLNDLLCGQTVYIALHAEVALTNEFGLEIQRETGWLDGPFEFPEGWGTYTDFTIAPACALEESLPADPITACFNYPNAPYSYWKTTLSGVPGGNILANQVYNGWCVDLLHYLVNGACHSVTALASLSNSLPPHAADSDWDMVNYVINNKGACGYLDVQAAIWFFIGTGAYPASPCAQGIVNDALANGEGFVPGDGDVVAVIINAGTSRQLTFIEVPCTCAGGDSNLGGGDEIPLPGPEAPGGDEPIRTPEEPLQF